MLAGIPPTGSVNPRKTALPSTHTTNSRSLHPLHLEPWIAPPTGDQSSALRRLLLSRPPPCSVHYARQPLWSVLLPTLLAFPFLPSALPLPVPLPLSWSAALRPSTPCVLVTLTRRAVMLTILLSSLSSVPSGAAPSVLLPFFSSQGCGLFAPTALGVDTRTTN